MGDSMWAAERLEELLGAFWMPRCRLSYTADAGFVFFGKSTAADATPATIFHTNHRVGYAINDAIEPRFVALDLRNPGLLDQQDRQRPRRPRNRELTAGLGVMFKLLRQPVHHGAPLGGVSGENRRSHQQPTHAYAW